ncbi:MAG: hypothetical protein IKC69_00280 [Clostridia bacterium]|nr:hypothetical protein [Clostridia bacterium]
MFVLTENDRFSEDDTDLISQLEGDPYLSVSSTSAMIRIELFLPRAFSELLVPVKAFDKESGYRFDLKLGLGSDGALSSYSPCTTSFFFSEKDHSCIGVYGIRNKRVDGVVENQAILSSFTASRGEAFADSSGTFWDADMLSSSASCSEKHGGMVFVFNCSFEELANSLPDSERDAYLNPASSNAELRYGYISVSVPIRFPNPMDSALLCIGIPKERAAHLSVGDTTFSGALEGCGLSDSDLPPLLPCIYLLQGSFDSPTEPALPAPDEDASREPLAAEPEKTPENKKQWGENDSETVVPPASTVSADKVVDGDLPADVFWEGLPDDFEDASDATEIVFFSSLSEEGKSNAVLGPILLCFAGVLLLVSVIVVASVFRNGSDCGKNDAKKQKSMKK